MIESCHASNVSLRHRRHRGIGILLAACIGALCGDTAECAGGKDGEWSLVLAWHDPAPALIGLNLQYLGSTFGFETGVGWAKLAADEDKRKAFLTLLGDVNVKYLFMEGFFRPYGEVGLTVLDNLYFGSSTGLDLSTGPGFLGGGFILGSASLYGNISAVYLQGQVWPQVGLGYGL